MSAQPYHKRYHSDALAGFMSLNLEERGAYQTILDMIYDRGGAIPNNERLIAGYMGCSVRKWRSLFDQLVEKDKIYLTDEGLISNARAEKEIENYAKTSRKHAENGSNGGRKKAEKQKKDNENNKSEVARLEQKSSLLPEARSQSSVSKETGEPPSLAEQIWGGGLAYLLECGVETKQARSMLGKWRKQLGEAGTLAALAHCQANSVSEPIAYVEGRIKSGGNGNDARREFLRKQYGEAA